MVRQRIPHNVFDVALSDVAVDAAKISLLGKDREKGKYFNDGQTEGGVISK